MKSHKGITLIALVVTIVVLLILAGVSISMLSGDNGIITQAQKAKEQTTISKEKESISLAKGAIRSRGEEVGKDNLQEELDRIEGEGKTEVTLKEDLSGLEIKFIDTDNKYEEVITIEVSEEEQSYWTYEDNSDGTITLLKYNPPAENLSGLIELVVPNKIGGKKVKCVGSGDTIWGDNISEMLSIGCGSVTGQSTIERIVIQNGIEEINSFAFQGCKSMQNIIIPNSITNIENGAFIRCESLKEIKIPKGVTNIESVTFAYCSSLTSVNLPDGIISINAEAFGHCGNLTSINMPDSLTSIRAYAFMYCGSLTSINIPNNVTEIESHAFESCVNLTNINIPDGITVIELSTFKGCNSLTSINIPDSVTSIEKWAFLGCSSITDINIPGSVTSIGGKVFDGCSSLTTINLEASEIPSTWDSNWKGDCTATVNTGVKM